MIRLPTVLIGIDYPGDDRGGKEALDNMEDLGKRGRINQQLHFLRTESQDYETRDRVQSVSSVPGVNMISKTPRYCFVGLSARWGKTRDD